MGTPCFYYLNSMLQEILHIFICLDLFEYNLFLMIVLVASYWKLQHLPSRVEWFQKHRFILLMNNLSARAGYYQGHESKVAKFKKRWSPFCSTGVI